MVPAEKNPLLKMAHADIQMLIIISLTFEIQWLRCCLEDVLLNVT